MQLCVVKLRVGRVCCPDRDKVATGTTRGIETVEYISEHKRMQSNYLRQRPFSGICWLVSCTAHGACQK